MRGQPPRPPAHSLSKPQAKPRRPVKRSETRTAKHFHCRDRRKIEAVQSAALHISGSSQFGKETVRSHFVSTPITFCAYGYVRSSRIMRGTRAEGVGSDPESAQEMERRKQEECDVRFLLKCVRPALALFLGGYVDDTNPSASEQCAVWAVLPVWHSMWAGSRARNFGVHSVGIAGRVSGGAIHEPTERQRDGLVRSGGCRRKAYFNRPRDWTAADRYEQRDRALSVPGCASGCISAGGNGKRVCKVCGGEGYTRGQHALHRTHSVAGCGCGGVGNGRGRNATHQSHRRVARQRCRARPNREIAHCRPQRGGVAEPPARRGVP